MRKLLATLASSLGLLAVSCRTTPMEEPPISPAPQNDTLTAPVVRQPESRSEWYRRRSRHARPGSFMWDAEYNKH